jgi:hypothetical protein
LAALARPGIGRRIIIESDRGEPELV